MFGPKHIKLAKKTATEVFAMALAPLALANRNLGRNKFTVPEGLWEDPYVIGFMNDMAYSILFSEHGGSGWRVDKLSEFMSQYWKTMCRADAQKAKAIVSNCINDKGSAGQEFKKGSADASEIYGVFTGRTRLEHLDPVYFENISPDLLEHPRDMATKSAVAGQMTIQKMIAHLAANYILPDALSALLPEELFKQEN